MVRDTSIKAYNEIKENGLLKKRMWQAFDHIAQNGPCTGASIPLKGGWKLTSPLKKRGVIKEVGTTVDPETHKTVYLWGITGELPKELPPEDPKVKKLNKLISMYRKGALSVHEFVNSVKALDEGVPDESQRS